MKNKFKIWLLLIVLLFSATSCFLLRPPHDSGHQNEMQQNHQQGGKDSRTGNHDNR